MHINIIKIKVNKHNDREKLSDNVVGKTFYTIMFENIVLVRRIVIDTFWLYRRLLAKAHFWWFRDR